VCECVSVCVCVCGWVDVGALVHVLERAHPGSRFKVQGLGSRVQGSGCRVQGSGFRVWVEGARLKCWSSRFGVRGAPILVQGFKFWGLGCQGLGFGF
jgi:hypothetical protein